LLKINKKEEIFSLEAEFLGLSFVLIFNSIIRSFQELIAIWNNRSFIGGFNTAYYWSSSEQVSSASQAWGKFGSNGTEVALSKSSTLVRVRPCRYFEQ
jgi:hypothetical protein